MTSEEAYIKNIENGIRAIRTGTKTPADSKVGVNLNLLKKVNVGLFEDYMVKYKAVLAEIQK